jgi:acetyl-CoA acetyltransferase
MTTSLKRGSAAIVGVAESDLGEVAANMTAVDLMAQGVSRALGDCGLSLADVDGVFAAATQSRMASMALCEYLGIQPKFHDTTYMGGSSFMTLVAHAQAAIEAGLCEVAVIAYGSTQRTSGRNNVAPRDFNPYESPYKPVLPASAYALAASRHMYQYGTTREQLAHIAVAARQWALLNPAAWEKSPLTVDEVLAARMVMTSAERARSLKQPPAFVLGVGERLSHLTISNMPDLTVTGALHSGQEAYRMAGLTPEQIDVVEVYDAFTITTLLFLEDLGFCPKGEGGPFVQHGAIAPGGRLAVNTNGGGLSYCHPGMYGLFPLIEAARQIRGECGARQIKDTNTAIVHGNGGVLSSQSTVILGSAATV